MNGMFLFMYYSLKPNFSKIILKGHTPVIAARDNAMGGIQRTQEITLHPVRVLPIATTQATDKNVILVAETFFFKRLIYFFIVKFNFLLFRGNVDNSF
jgi:hypothetical protein